MLSKPLESVSIAAEYGRQQAVGSTELIQCLCAEVAVYQGGITYRI